MRRRVRSIGLWSLIAIAGVLAGIASLLAGPIVIVVSAVMAVLLARTNGANGVGAYLTGVGVAWLPLMGLGVLGAPPDGMTPVFAVAGGLLMGVGAVLTVLGGGQVSRPAGRDPRRL
jgi:hypothetical protein